MRKEVEFGIRVSVKDGKTAATEIKEIGDAAAATSTQIEKAGLTMSTELEAGAQAARNTATAVSSVSDAANEFKGSTAGIRQVTQDTVNHFQSLENTSKQTAHAIRMLPAQFTDVVTQLAGGANPLLVLIQQGGQVKDAFGGIGPMFRGIASMITPTAVAVTGLAAAVGGLAYAAYKGHEESENLNKAIALTGNFAGVTEGRIIALSQSLAQVERSGVSSAREALLSLVDAGVFTGRVLESAGTAALIMAKYTGQSSQEVVGNFAKMENGVAKWAEENNKQYHFLNVAQYEHIRTLEEQGQKQEAMQATFTALTNHMPAQVENLGLLQRAWRSLSNEISAAIESVKAFGRPETVEQKLAAVSSAIESYNPFNVFGPNLEQLRDRQAALQEEQRLQAKSAALQAVQAETNKAGISASNYLKKLDDEKRGIDRVKQALDDYRVQLDAYNKANPNNPRTAAQIAQDEAHIRKKYADKSAGTNPALGNREVADIRAQIAVQDQLTASLVKYGLEAEKVTAGDRKVAEIQQQLTLAQKDRTGKLTDAALKEQLVEAQRLAAAEKRNAALKKGLQLQADVTAEIAKWTNASQAAQDLLEEEISLIGMGTEARRIASAQTKVDADLRAFLAEQQKKGQKLLPDEIALLQLEAQARKNNIAAIEGQRQALAGAEQLRQENRRFAADAIADEQERARAILEIEADTWRERIRLAGEGTEAQKQLQEQFDQWYANRLNKPMIDESRRFAEAINNDFREGFRNMVNQGMGTWKSASKSMATTFKTAIADALYKAFAQKYVVNIAANILGMIGLGGTSAAAQLTGGDSSGGLGILGSASSLFSAGKAIWSGFSGGLASSMGGIVSTFGNMVGSSAISSFGAGMGMTTAQAASATGAAAVNAGVGVSGSAGTAMTAGASFAKAIPVIGWIIAGMMKNASLYDQGWDAGNGTMSAFAKYNGITTGPLLIDKALRGIGLSGKAAAILSGSSLISRAFGRKNPEVESFGIEGTFSESNFTGNQFARIIEKGGWFRSDKHYTNRAALTEDMSDTLNIGIQSVIAATKGYAQTLGIQADAIKGYSKSIVLDLDNDPQKQQEIIGGLFGTIADEVSTRLIPSIADFSKKGETASVTLQRLSDEFTATDAIATALGKTAEKAFGAVGLASVAARERLINLAGGIDALAAGNTFFTQHFFTEAEQMAPLIRSVTEEMARLGHAEVDTKEEFKDLVLGLNLSSEAGAQLYADLMRVQEGFSIVADYNKRMTDEAIENARRQSEETIRLQRQALSDAMSMVDSSFSSLQRSVEAERDAVTKKNAQTIEALNKRMSSVTESISKITNLSNVLRSAANDMRLGSQIGGDRAAAQAQITTAIAIARASGVLPDADQLADALNVLSQPTEGLFESAVDFQRDRFKTQISLNELADVSDSQLSIEEQTLQSLQDQVKQEQENYAAEMTRLDSIVSSAQAQLDLLGGIQNGVLAIPAALQQFNSAIAAARANPIASATPQIADAYQTYLHRAPEQTGLEYWQDQVASGTSVSNVVSAIANSNEAKVQELYSTILGRVGEAEGVNYWAGRLETGATLDQVKQEFLGSVEYLSKNPPKVPAFASGGVHTGGWRLVGERGPELEFTPPSRIFNAADTARMLQGGNDSGLLAEITLLREIVEKLIRSSGKTAESTELIAKVLDKSSAGGPLLVELA